MTPASMPQVQPLHLGLPILQLLRQATAVHHQALEDALGLDRPGLTRAAYVRLVRRMRALYIVLEEGTAGYPGLNQHAAAFAALGLRWPTRSKRGLLDQDLQALRGLPVPSAHYPKGQVDLGRVAQGMGCLYVLEGSTLGGQIIVRRLKASLQLTPTTGTRFFTSYGNRVGMMWREYRHTLQTEIVTPHTKRDCLNAAVQTFVLFRRWLTP